MDGSISFIVIW